jgi:hypothetical protein
VSLLDGAVARIEYEHLLRRLEILGRLTVGDTEVAPSAGSSLDEFRERGEHALADLDVGVLRIIQRRVRRPQRCMTA